MRVSKWCSTRGFTMTKIPGMLIAGVVFGGSITIFGVAVVDAMRVESAPQIEVLAIVPTDATMQVATPAIEPADSEAWVAETTSAKLPSVALERAVNQDPFQPNRRAPAQRYVLPDQRPVFTQVEREPTPAPEFRVVGTARVGQGGLVLVQVDDGDMPIAVSVGESIEGYRVVSVTGEGATLAADGGTWALSVVEPREERRSINRDRNTRQRIASDQLTWTTSFGNLRDEAVRLRADAARLILPVRGGGGGGR